MEQLRSSVAILRRRAELAKTVFDCPNLSGPSVMPDVLDHLLSAHEMQTVPVDTVEPVGSPLVVGDLFGRISAQRALNLLQTQKI